MADPGLIQPIDFQEQAENIREEFLARQAQNIQRAELLPPKDPNTDFVTDATNIFFGDFGKALGFKLDQRGLRWNVETAKEAWSEHPVRSAIEVGMNLAPVAFKALQLSRAAKVAGVTDEAINAMNLVDDGIDLAAMGEKEKRILQGQVWNLQRMRDLQDKIDSGLASNGEKFQHFLDKKFGNSYMEAADPEASVEYMKGWVDNFKNDIADNDTFKNLMRNAPPDEEGVKMAQYFLEPSNDNFRRIPKQYRPWAMQMSNELRMAQSQMVKEGLISADEAKKVGPMYFSMLREGTPQAEIGAYTRVLNTSPDGKTEWINIPKTSSPNLLERKASKGEVKNYLIRQEAAQALERGNISEAKGLLRGEAANYKSYKDAQSLTEEEKQAVKRYITNATGLNMDLRAEYLWDPDMISRDENLQKVIKNRVIDNDTVVYRGMGNFTDENFIKKWTTPGSEITDPGYLSTTESWNYVKEFGGDPRIILKINVPKGTKGLKVPNEIYQAPTSKYELNLSKLQHEQEVILDKGQKLRIRSTEIQPMPLSRAEGKSIYGRWDKEAMVVEADIIPSKTSVPDYSDVHKLIDKGDTLGAVKALTTDGKVDLSPKSITTNSLAKQKALLETYRTIRDVAIRYAKKGEELTPQLKNDWVSLDSLEGSNRLRRMVGISKGLEGPVDELGFVPKKLFNEISDIFGMEKAGQEKPSSIFDILDLGTAWYKTTKTSLNLPTHAQNILGNTIFMWNGGVNVLGKNYWDIQKKTWNAVREMQKAFRATGRVGELGDLGSIKTLAGKTIRLADEITSPEAHELAEMSTLLSAEGIGAINRIADAAKEGDMVQFLGKIAKKATEAKIPGTNINMAKVADVYMAEDGAMKLAYFMTLRQKGFSRKAALLEVGRRMPMYNTVGDVWKGLRRSVQPWITFPVEAARILKNNMMDFPLKTSLMMQLPHFAQLGSYGTMRAMGRGQSYQTINDRKEQLPLWASRPSTVMTPWVDVNGDFRHATLDFLPYTSVMPTSIHPDAPITQKLPIFQEPMPILSGLYYAATGKDAWGREIPANSITEKVKYSAIQLAGFLSPPIIDKYMLNANDPTAFYRLNQDLGRYPNRYTGKEGDPFFDFFMNSVIGLKSYPSSPEQAIANKEFKGKDIDAYKARMSKEAAALLKIGDTSGAGDRLEDIYSLLLEQHGDPTTARRKFNDFLKRFMRKNRTASVFQGMSMEQIERELELGGDRIAYESGLVRNEYINTLRQARAQQKGSQGGMFNPLLQDAPTVGNF